MLFWVAVCTGSALHQIHDCLGCCYCSATLLPDKNQPGMLVRLQDCKLNAVEEMVRCFSSMLESTVRSSRDDELVGTMSALLQGSGIPGETCMTALLPNRACCSLHLAVPSSTLHAGMGCEQQLGSGS